MGGERYRREGEEENRMQEKDEKVRSGKGGKGKGKNGQKDSLGKGGKGEDGERIWCGGTPRQSLNLLLFIFPGRGTRASRRCRVRELGYRRAST